MELAGAPLRLFNRIADIGREVGRDDTGEMRAAWNDERRRQGKHAEPDRQTFQEVPPGDDEQNPYEAGQWDQEREGRLYPIPDQNFLQEQDHENRHKIEVHIRQTVRQGRCEVVRQGGDRQGGGECGGGEAHHRVAAVLHAFEGVLHKIRLGKRCGGGEEGKRGYEGQG